MAKKGTCLLPLHYGSAPRWLFERMVRLSREIISVIVMDFGPDEFLERLSDPYWFQALGCVLGFDWHSSGLTTTVCGAVKEALKETQREILIYAAGGKGAASRKTPDEIEFLISKNAPALDSKKYVYASRMAAKVDNTALQDGYQLYHHSFFFSKSGLWAVVQQGMNTQTRWARRYHWLSKDLKDFVNEPEKAICCDHKGNAFNMVAGESGDARDASAFLAKERPEKIIGEVEKLSRLKLPEEHRLFFSNLKKTSLQKVLLSTYTNQPQDFERLLGIRGVGPKTIRALALLAELIYGSRVSRKDPAKYSFAHGGKDGHPYPIDRSHYDKSIEVLGRALREAKIGRTEKKDAFKRLAQFS
ncbi:MAG: hypothetical protein A2Z72_00025 [Omnitrophica bacterium RBG_13_46_9]|nr:MAG: hypothetical protein A2Z72_00025 [Omnitrophica bacterium RBG_13_46_9]